jgi:hypothetical protein
LAAGPVGATAINTADAALNTLPEKGSDVRSCSIAGRSFDREARETWRMQSYKSRAFRPAGTMTSYVIEIRRRPF